MNNNPIKISESIKEAYISYLKTSFNINNNKIRNDFINQLDEDDKLVKGPILEATPPFEIADSIRDMIEDNILSKEFVKLNSDNFPIDRKLYFHQVQAIKKIVQDNRNIVVSTGTGSGKTECFLIPIVNYLMHEKENGILTPGVRAILLYPMNALVNDQLKRLRDLLKDYPKITFGRFTGETKETQNEAEDNYYKVYGEKPLKNELISRQQMHITPPHILITNYAMLEYMLLRPEDNVFFDGNYAKYWKFLVLDEAHTYNGAKGIEMAMLIRRLKDRITNGKKGVLTCIATSATIGRGRQDYPNVVKFASQLFDEIFEWDDKNINKQDVISAKRINFKINKPWGTPDKEFYKKANKYIENNDSDINILIDISKESNIPDSVINNAYKISNFNSNRFLYEILKGDSRFITLRDELNKKASYLKDISKIIFDSDKAVEYTIDLVNIAVKLKQHNSDIPLLPARYHFFIKSIEGAYLCFLPELKLFLDRYKFINHDNCKYPVFEIATCNNCGAIYIVGKIEGEENKYLRQIGAEWEKAKYFLLINKDEILIDDEDEDIIFGFDELIDKESRYKLCTKCGAIEKYNSIKKMCDCDEKYYKIIILVSEGKDKVFICPSCGKRNPRGIVRRFLTGPEATSSVLASALYQNIKTYGEEKKFKNKMLIFSDSRQDAAFFAPYFETTYNLILRRKIIYYTLKNNSEKIKSLEWRLEDLIYPMLKFTQNLNIFDDRMSKQQQLNEIWKWLLYEFVNIDRTNGLEALGILTFKPVKPNLFIAPAALKTGDWDLTDDEIWMLYRFILDSFRTKGAILYPDEINPEDNFFEPRNRQIYFRQKDSDSKKHILSYNSTISHKNSRLDYLIKLANKINPKITPEECQEVLDNIWKYSFGVGDNRSNFKNYFIAQNLNGEGNVYKLSYEMWELDINNDDWFICDRCNNLTKINIRGICPTYNCKGTLHKCSPQIINSDNHYYKLYKQEYFYPIKIKEHTAQLNSLAAAELQSQFVNGDINMLSCSTTFELGVDVGDLETVFLRNMPPSPSNYIQRAGRAGRRSSSTAFVLTFAQRKSHDISYFNNPFKMVSGEIKAPYFEIENEKIIKRHIYAVAISKFWRKYNNYYGFGKVSDFFMHEGIEKLRYYLKSKPKEVYKSILNIVPENMRDKLQIDKWGWIDSLLDKNEGVLYLTYLDFNNDLNQLNKAKKYYVSQEKYSKAAYISKVINTLMDRSLINYMSSHNILPKYGFPVDVVELKLPIEIDQDASNLELNRDMKIAIAEYAPDSQVVAGGKIWTGRYLNLIPEKTWPKYYYTICENCNNYKSVLITEESSVDLPITCEFCHHPIGKNRGKYIEPEFGFIADKNVLKPGDDKPQRTYATRVYFSGKANLGSSVELNLNGINLYSTFASRGKLAVINSGGNQRFSVCNKCGYAVLGRITKKQKHLSPWNSECNGSFETVSIGHEFETDILQLRLDNYNDTRQGFWLSLLYAIIEGASEALEIERQDLDGCLYTYAGKIESPALIIFDNVPGGAGHAKRIGEKNNLLLSLNMALNRMKQCTCGGNEGESSCYGCLRNYTNQYCHDMLNRGMVIKFLSKVLG